MDKLIYGDVTVLGKDRKSVESALVKAGIAAPSSDPLMEGALTLVDGVSATFRQIILEQATEDSDAVYGDYAYGLRVNGVDLSDLDYVPTDYDLHPNFGREGVPEAPKPPTRNIRAEVEQHALKLKIGVVNATRTDGKTDPVTPDALAEIEARYSRVIQEFLTDSELGEDVSAMKPIIRIIRAGEKFFDAVNEAAAKILGDGDAADPIATDARWPPLPK